MRQHNMRYSSTMLRWIVLLLAVAAIEAESPLPMKEVTPGAMQGGRTGAVGLHDGQELECALEQLEGVVQLDGGMEQLEHGADAPDDVMESLGARSHLQSIESARVRASSTAMQGAQWATGGLGNMFRGFKGLGGLGVPSNLAHLGATGGAAECTFHCEHLSTRPQPRPTSMFVEEIQALPRVCDTSRTIAHACSVLATPGKACPFEGCCSKLEECYASCNAVRWCSHHSVSHHHRQFHSLPPPHRTIALRT